MNDHLQPLQGVVTPGSASTIATRLGGIAPYHLGDQVTVKAPATSANLGCAFDCAGIAVDLWLTLTVTVASDFEYSISGECDPNIPLDGSNSVVISFMLGLRRLRAMPPKSVQFHFRCDNHIPIGRGLGSSAAAIVAGIGAAFVLCRRSLDDPAVLREISILACRRECHPDNILPTIFGGMQIGVLRTAEDGKMALCPDELDCVPLTENSLEEYQVFSTGDYFRQPVPFPSDELVCVIYVPEARLSTVEARKLVKQSYSISEVISNIGRASMLIAALTTRKYTQLKYAVADRLHQPFRASVVPAFEALMEAAPLTNALAVYISGAGPSVVSWCQRRHSEEVVEDYQRLCSVSLSKVPGKFIVCGVVECGLQRGEIRNASLKGAKAARIDSAIGPQVQHVLAAAPIEGSLRS